MSKKRLTSLCLLVIVFFSFLPTPTAYADGGIAISGSFYRHHFKLVPGERVASPHINVVIYNNYDHEIEIKLVSNTPEGVHIELEQKVLKMSANSSRTLPIVVRVEETVVPDEYRIGIYAEVVPQPGAGIAITGSAEMRSQLSVFGEAARVNIKTVTMNSELFRTKLHLFHKLENQLEPAGYSDTGEMAERVIPGTYFVQAYWEGTEVAQQEFTVEVDQEKDITLTAQTVFLTGFSAQPRYSEETDKVSSARITYGINNIYKPVEDARTVLTVLYDGEPLEELEMYAVPTLPVGTSESRYTFIPAQGWKSGTYSFKVGLYSAGRLYAETEIKEFTVYPSFFRGAWLIGSVATLALVFFIFLWKRRQCRTCKGTKSIKCTHCNGLGHIETRNSKCITCDGTGKLNCPDCKQK